MLLVPPPHGVSVCVNARFVQVRIHYQLEISDLCVWFTATMMDDMVIRISPPGWGLSCLAVKVNSCQAYNRVAT